MAEAEPGGGGCGSYTVTLGQSLPGALAPPCEVGMVAAPSPGGGG